MREAMDGCRPEHRQEPSRRRDLMDLHLPASSLTCAELLASTAAGCIQRPQRLTYACPWSRGALPSAHPIPAPASTAQEHVRNEQSRAGARFMDASNRSCCHKEWNPVAQICSSAPPPPPDPVRTGRSLSCIAR
ncbi:hypothetical protein D1007_28853 [Hordeum vulgare]|nr:hypothetical protein D1007_28853 [Hordeum vulgare]